MNLTMGLLCAALAAEAVLTGLALLRLNAVLELQRENRERLCAAASAGQLHADAVTTALRAMNLELRDLTPKSETPPDPEKERKAREAIDRFNDGISAILDYDGGGKK